MNSKKFVLSATVQSRSTYIAITIRVETARKKSDNANGLLALCLTFSHPAGWREKSLTAVEVTLCCVILEYIYRYMPCVGK